MTETTKGFVWLCFDITKDLEGQVGIEIIIDQLSFKGNSCTGVIKSIGKPIDITWQPYNKLLSIIEDQPELSVINLETLEADTKVRV